jgi:hypothetical protein
MTDKIMVEDANKLDKRIPRDLIIMYQGKPFITKAGLCWKMNYLFGGKNWGVVNDIVEKTQDSVIVKSTLTLKDGAVFSNFGEASKVNVSNPMMLKHLLHLAVTRAENRVMRTATACGYTSIDEIDTGAKEIPVSETDSEKATPAQISTIKAMKGEVIKDMTQSQAKAEIARLAERKV